MTAFEPSLYFRSPSLNSAGRPHMGQRSRCRASKAGHMSAIDPLVRISLPLLNPRGRSLIASPLSIAACFLFVCLTGVTVLSAVGSVRRNIWFEAQALQCPQRARS
jgi:hypothetical protein